jgi:hypothetical protein
VTASFISLIHCSTITFRFIGNYETILKWSSRNKKKLREPAEYPISARESFDSWNKVIDSGTMRQAKLKLGNSEDEDEDEEEEDDDEDEEEEEEEEEEESDEDDEDEIQEKKRNKKDESSSSERAKAHKSYSSEVVTEGEKRPVKIDYSFMGSTGTASGSMGNDGMVVRQPSIVRDLWAQVSHSPNHPHTQTHTHTLSHTLTRSVTQSLLQHNGFYSSQEYTLKLISIIPECN